MARVTPTDLARLEQEAAAAKARLKVKEARVRRAQEHQRMQHEQALLTLLKSLGLTAYPVETLRGPLATVAQQMQAAQEHGRLQAGESPA
jgi:hypothetical protein